MFLIIIANNVKLIRTEKQKIVEDMISIKLYKFSFIIIHIF